MVMMIGRLTAPPTTTTIIIQCSNKAAASKEMYSLATAQFSLPGEPSFPSNLNGLFNKPKANEREQMLSYFKQLRLELGTRLVEKVYTGEGGQASKVGSLVPARPPFLITSQLTARSILLPPLPSFGARV